MAWRNEQNTILSFLEFPCDYVESQFHNLDRVLGLWEFSEIFPRFSSVVITTMVIRPLDNLPSPWNWLAEISRLDGLQDSVGMWNLSHSIAHP